MMGPNGSGKTTLLETLLGLRDADGGHIKWGANLNIGYYDQKLEDFDTDNTVLEEVAEGRSQYKEQELRDMLAMMLFRGEDVHKPIHLLSGGERARVRLVELLLDAPNVLVLDEPTNHLDIASREALENALGGFAGTILCVSHDRYFLNKMAGRLVILQPPGLIDFFGNYSRWLEKEESERQQREEAKAEKPKTVAPAPAKSKPTTKRTDNPYLRPFGRLTMEQLEQQIMETEVAIAECQESFGTPDTFKNPSRGAKLKAEYEELSRKLEQLEEEYFAREE
jgi:ATP-binding cassette subfamily F protein 3